MFLSGFTEKLSRRYRVPLYSSKPSVSPVTHILSLVWDLCWKRWTKIISWGSWLVNFTRGHSLGHTIWGFCWMYNVMSPPLSHPTEYFTALSPFAVGGVLTFTVGWEHQCWVGPCFRGSAPVQRSTGENAALPPHCPGERSSPTCGGPLGAGGGWD